MRIETRNIVSFYDLSPNWQAEAISNLDGFAENELFFEPYDDEHPTRNPLYDLSDAMRLPEGGKYHASIGISNNSGIGIIFSEDNTQAELHYL